MYAIPLPRTLVLLSLTELSFKTESKLHCFSQDPSEDFFSVIPLHSVFTTVVEDHIALRWLVSSSLLPDKQNIGTQVLSNPVFPVGKIPPCPVSQYEWGLSSLVCWGLCSKSYYSFLANFHSFSPWCLASSLICWWWFLTNWIWVLSFWSWTCLSLGSDF